MLLSIPIAWLQLIHQRVRFLVTLMGIAFVVTLLFLQLGFQAALFESAVRVHQSLQGDLFIVSSQYKSLTAQQRFSRTRLYQTLALDEVESVSPIYTQFGKLKNIDSGQKFSAFIFGVDISQPPFSSAEIKRNLNTLKLPTNALFDRRSRSEFGPIAERFDQGQQVNLEVSGFRDITEARRFSVSGLYNLGTSFGIDGSMIVNASAFLHTFRNANPEEINIGLVNLKPGSNPRRVQKILAANLSEDVKVFTRGEFVALEKAYWNLRTPVGFTFKLMVTIGFIVGIGVAYQVLYTNISNHLIEYATLKAIGFRNRYLLKTTLQQAFILAVLGFIPGIVIALNIYDLARQATSLPVIMTLQRSINVLLAVISMCSLSAVFAIQKLRAADPADIF